MIDPTIQQVVEQIHATPVKLVIEFTGAGSLALFWLHSVPGSSRTILEASDRYAATSLADLLGAEPEKSVAAETARAMAIQAYRRAMRLSDGATPMHGVACTASIVTGRPKRGEHHCWVAVRDAAGVSSYGLVLTKGMRDRLGEETVVSQLVLRAIAEACGTPDRVHVEIGGDERIETAREALADPIALLLEGAARSVMVSPDGAMAVDQPASGVILSGSFNPLHAGHERLAEAASTVTGRPLLFELPIVNADKPPLSYAEIERRLAQFRWRYPIVLTRAPLFSDKAALFPGSVFVVGYDTAARLLDPRYYGGEAGRDAALQAIGAVGSRFLVAGRLVDGVFHSLADLAIPAGLRDLFVELPERAFRVDLSSTEIRGRQQERGAA